MTAALNYAAQAERGLMRLSQKCRDDGSAGDADMLAYLARSIKNSVHFTVPYGGRVLDDDLKGIKGVAVRLPFPKITLEYSCDDYDVCAYAEELSLQKALDCGFISPTDVNQITGIYPHSETVISVALTVKRNGYWVPCPLAVAIPAAALAVTGEILSTDIKDYERSAIEENIDLPVFYARPYPLLLETCRKKGISPSREDRVYDIARDVSGYAVRPILEMCEALTCRNITTQNLQEASPKNAKRIAQGHLPFYETKILVIKNDDHNGSTLTGAGTHASPRQHLRRGHIRRLPKGNVWVNSCIVGDARKGIIKKSYQLA